MNSAKKGDWVKIHNILLQPEERAGHLPEDTKQVPLEMWVKGYLMNDRAEIGEKVTVQTYIGRKMEGTLVEINPAYLHHYGSFVKELSFIGNQVRELIEGGEDIG